MDNPIIACICEGGCEQAVIDLLLENDKLIFSQSQLLEGKSLRCRSAKKFQISYLDKSMEQPIRIYRILDSRNENFKLSKLYERKVEVVNIITAPEIEMLIIHAENKYENFVRSGKKPSDFAIADLKIGYDKSYEFVKKYFANVDKLINAIHQHRKIAHIPKNEKCLDDLLRK